jgi:peroxiredoxin
MRILSLKSPLGVPARPSVVGCRIRRRAFGSAISVVAIVAAFAARGALAQESSTDKPPDPKMGELIGRVRAEEAKYQDLEVVTRRSYRTVPGWTVQRMEETLDTVRQNGLCYAHVRIVRTLDSGGKQTEELVSAFDGERTRTVEMGNSVNVHLRRYEPLQVVPPHSWALAAWEVNFDLSTFLGGMPALRQDRKVRIPYHGGTIFEFSKLDFQSAGEETVDGLRCVKIHCERWNTPEHGPYVASIWLAIDRNLICAKMQEFYGTTREPGLESVVKDWRQIEPGLWLPARIHSERNVGNRKARRTATEDFTLESARPHPEHPAAFFRDVPLPKDLPVFTIDAEGHIADDPLLHLKPVANPQRRMQEVLRKIRENEALYRSFQATIERDEQFLAASSFSPRAASWSQERKVDVVRQGRRFRLSGRDEFHNSRGGWVDHLSAFDGTWLRSLRVTNDAVNPLGNKLPHGPGRNAFLQPADNFAVDSFAWSDYAPYLLPFDRFYYPKSASLADWLTADLVDSMDNQLKNKVTYLGSEIRDGLACDVVQLVNGFRGRASNNPPCMLIWIAKDRNYLPVRSEWRPRWHPLPTAFTRVEAFGEARPGVWYPQRIRKFAFVTTPGEGVLEHRLIVQERRETVVRSFALAPKRPDSEFRDVVISAGTTVSIVDADGKAVGNIQQEKTGIAALSDEEWTRLVLERLQNGLKHDEPERDQEKRLARGNALLGKSPPELPRTWLNGKAIDWNELKGKTVLLYLWAMWDGESCRQAKRLSDQVEPLKTAGIAVIGAHAMGTSPADVDRAVKLFELNFPVCIDPPAREKLLAWGPLWTQCGVRTLPVAVVIDATGHVADFGAIDSMLVKARELAQKGH